MRGLVLLVLNLSSTLLLSCYGSTLFSSPGKTEVWSFEDIYSGSGIAASPTVAQPPVADIPAVGVVVLLASEKTRRRDPLHGFQMYDGGWNLTDRHYLASAASTAYPLYAAASLWLVAFGTSLVVLCLCHFRRKRHQVGMAPLLARPLYLVLLLLFLAAIAGCFTAYTGERRFHAEGTAAAGRMWAEARAVAGNLRAVSGNVGTARRLDPFNVSLPAEVEAEIDSVGAEIDASVTALTDRVSRNSERISSGLHSLRTELVAVVALVLFLTVLGLLFSFLEVHLLGYILVVVGWIAVTVTFLYCAAFLFLHVVTSDGCVSMDQWLKEAETPAVSAMDDVLPCSDQELANRTLYLSREVTYQLVELLNAVITNISNTNFSPLVRGFYFNQSGPLLSVLCNPFRPDLSDRPCSPSEVDLHFAAPVYKGSICEVSDSGICTTPGRLKPTDYDQLVAGLNAGSALYDDGPFLTDLKRCRYVRDGLGYVRGECCPGLLSAGKMVYSGMAAAGVALMLSVVLWLVYLRGGPGTGPPLGLREEGGGGGEEGTKVSTVKLD